MFSKDWLPILPGLELADVDFDRDIVTIHAATTALQATCPRCGVASTRVQSRYLRTLADKPLAGRPLRIRISVRRFACVNPMCDRAIFAEPLPELADPHAWTTADLADAHAAIGFAAGGEGGSRLAHTLDMPTSPDTVLRRVQAADLESGPPPRYVGLDDWAIRKGQNYGTMVVDLERGRVVALLPGRDGEAVAERLRASPDISLVNCVFE